MSSTGTVAVALPGNESLIDASLSLSYETLAELAATLLSDIPDASPEQRPWYWVGRLELALIALAEAVSMNREERIRQRGSAPLGSEGRT